MKSFFGLNFFAGLFVSVLLSGSCLVNASPLDASSFKKELTRLYTAGNYYLSQKNYDLAEQYFLDALKLAPGVPAIHHSLGLVYIQQDDLESAIHYFEEAIRIRPDQFKSYYALAKAYKEKGYSDEAKATFEKAIVANPNVAQSYNNLAQIYYEEGDWKHALEYFEQGRQLSSDSVPTLMLTAIAAIKAERSDIALEIITDLRDRGEAMYARRVEYMLYKHQTGEGDESLTDGVDSAQSSQDTSNT